MKFHNRAGIFLLFSAFHGIIFAQSGSAKGIIECPPRCFKDDGVTKQVTPSSVEKNQQIINAIGAFGAAMEQSTRQQADRERQEEVQRLQEEGNRQQEWQRQQQERAQQQQIDQQVRAAVERARQDPSLNPFGKAPAGDSSSAENSPKGSATPTQDPSADLTGQSCKWLVVRDEETCSSRLCHYSEGQTIAYGPRAYRCEAGRWSKQRDCTQSISEQRKMECLRDIPNIYGIPKNKETPAPKIYD